MTNNSKQSKGKGIEFDKYGKLIKLEPLDKPKCIHCGRSGIALNNGVCIRCFNFNSFDFNKSVNYD